MGSSIRFGGNVPRRSEYSARSVLTGLLAEAVAFAGVLALLFLITVLVHLIWG